MPTETFWTERTDRERRYLRCWVAEHDGPWTCGNGWHEARVALPGDFPGTDSAPDRGQYTDGWPTECGEGCGYQFTDVDIRQVFTDVIYRCEATGLEWPMRDLPPGAMYDATWLDGWRAGEDGIHLAVVLPGGRMRPWYPDQRASNCTLPDDDVHRCWVRHGDPRTAPVTVDKNGVTCQAGGGSIAIDGYHGFLTDGQLTDG